MSSFQRSFNHAISLEHQSQLILAELGDLTNDSLQIVSMERMPAFIGSFISSLSGFMTTTQGTDVAGFTSGNPFPNVLKNAKYTVLSPVEVYIPEGLNGTLPEYLSMLESWHSKIGNIVERLLQPFQEWLALGLSDPVNLSKITSSARWNIADPKVLQKELKAVVNTNKDERRPFSEVVSSINEWNVSVDRLNALELAANSEKLSDIKASINTVIGSLELLINRIEESPETYKVSKSTLAALVNLTHAAAVEVELYTVYRHNLKTATQAVVDTLPLLKKVTK